jgi:hypothetical protein
MNNQIDLSPKETKDALACMTNLNRCNTEAPYLQSKERTRHIKNCQELAILCYLQIIKEKNK